jgi:hypothetical protein
MKSPLRRRRKPRTVVGKAIRAWPWLRFALKVLKAIRRVKPFAVPAAAAGALVVVLRRLRGRRASGPGASSSYPPPSSVGTAAAVSPPGPATREAGLEASTATQTERRLEAERAGGKLDVDGPNESAPGDSIPPPAA